MTIGSLTLTPAFDTEVTSYVASTSNATNNIKAVAADSSAVISITNNGTAVVNQSAVTWDSGENTVVITVTNGSEETVYTVTVTKT